MLFSVHSNLQPIEIFIKQFIYESGTFISMHIYNRLLCKENTKIETFKYYIICII